VLARLLRIINIGIAAIGILFISIVYWFAIRPLPRTTGEISAPISAPATIQRDARGVPHIEAASWQDAIFLQGYVTAQDRLWQMDGLRRYAAGELAEIVGPGAVPLDQRARVLRMRAMAEADVARLSAEDRDIMVQYARGVNHFIETHRGDYSLEFSIPFNSYDPRPWTLTDSMLVGLLMFRDLTDSLADDTGRGALLNLGADPAKFRILFPAIEGISVSPGSNAWAVSGAHTGSGQPMVANDPHLRYTVPGTWHLVHLKAPGLNVSGAALPGMPCVISGHNENIAWGVTNLETDVFDVYVEQIDERTGRYVFQGKVEQAQLDRQTITVKGGKPVRLNLWVTRHGPVFSENGKSYSVRWSAAEGFGFPFFKIDQAKNWNEFRAALRSFWGPGQNFVYGDHEGNIGYQATGAVPIRRNFDGNVPLDGASGQFEWDGYIPFEQLPSVYNPASGIVATANQNPFPKDYAYRISGGFADPYRVQQIRARLTAKAKLTVDDMLDTQKDVYSAYDFFLAKQAVASYAKLSSPAKNALLKPAVELLGKWNGQMEASQSAPAIAELLSNALRLSLLKLLVPKAKELPDVLPRPQVVETLLRGRPVGWVPNDNWDEWLISALSRALDQGRARLGSTVAEWRWGFLLHWKFEHPVIKRLPPVEWFFNATYQRNSGPFEMSGSATTVKQTTPTLGPSERMVVDMGDLDHSVQNLVLGESGFVSSSHFEDQWPAYYYGKSFPMQFNHVDGKDVLKVKAQ
jgi:penicillin G amidase